MVVSSKIAQESLPGSQRYPDLKMYIAALMQPKVGNKKRNKSLNPLLSNLVDIVSEVLYNFSK